MRLAKDANIKLLLKNLTEVQKYYKIIGEVDKVKEINETKLRILKLEEEKK